MVPIIKGSKVVTAKFDESRLQRSPVISKVFEHCMLRRFEAYFVTSDNQLGFKKRISCSHAIFTVRSVINHYTALGSTVNLCAIDISKAFDRMNHNGMACFHPRGAKRCTGISRHRVCMCVCECVCVCLSVCHTPVLYQNG